MITARFFPLCPEPSEWRHNPQPPVQKMGLCWCLGPIHIPEKPGEGEQALLFFFVAPSLSR
jgi:hypothetical protein